MLKSKSILLLLLSFLNYIFLNAQLQYGSYFGKMNSEEFKDCSKDEKGNYYFVGSYFINNGNNPDLPTDSNSFQKQFGGGSLDFFIASFDHAYKLRWCTYLGSSQSEDGRISCKIINNQLYVIFETNQQGFAYNTNEFKKPIKRDFCLMKFNTNGKLVKSQYLGGSFNEYFTDWDVDSDFNILITGKTNSRDSISTNPSYCYKYPGESAGYPYYDSSEFPFVIKIDTNFKKLYGSYFGGFQKNGNVPKIKCDSKKNYYIAVMNSGYKLFGNTIDKSKSSGGIEIELARFTKSHVLEWSTLLGGERNEELIELDVDENDNVLITGQTNSKYSLIDSTIFPKITELNSANYNFFIAKFSSTGNRIFSRYLGGNGSERDVFYPQKHNRTSPLPDGKFGCIVRTNVQNYTLGNNYPYQSKGNGGIDGIFYILDSTGKENWSTYLGGNTNDEFYGFFYDSKQLTFWGSTQSSLKISTQNAYQPLLGGYTDGFIQTYTIPFSSKLDIKPKSKQCLSNNIFNLADNSFALDSSYQIIDSFSDGTVYQNKRQYSHSFKTPGNHYIKHYIKYGTNPNYYSMEVKNVFVYNEPQISKITVLKDTSFTGESFVLMAYTNDTIQAYHWYFDTSYIGSGKVINYKSDSLGPHKITCLAYSNIGCKTSKTTTVFIKPRINRTNTLINQINFNIYPNPTNSILNISLNAITPISKTNIKLFDLSGRLLISLPFPDSEEFKLSIKEQLGEGIFILMIEMDNYTIVTKKIVVN